MNQHYWDVFPLGGNFVVECDRIRHDPLDDNWRRWQIAVDSIFIPSFHPHPGALHQSCVRGEDVLIVYPVFFFLLVAVRLNNLLDLLKHTAKETLIPRWISAHKDYCVNEALWGCVYSHIMP